MAIRIVRLGEKRAKGEGLRLGTVRHLPRGVPKSEYASRDLFDLWLPELAPSAELVRWIHDEPDLDVAWPKFARRYRSEMKQPAPGRLLDLLAALSHQTALAVGCYCDEASRCHRSVLAELLAERGAEIV